MENINKIIIAIGAALIVVAGYFVSVAPGGSNKNLNLDVFTRCLKDKGAVFYGAFWCPHCQNQKKLFGESEKLLPYVECSTEDRKDQTQICKDKNIVNYPTWKYPDGTREVGEIPLAKLAEKTGCQLPAGK